MPRSFETGQRIAGRYELTQQLGQGTVGEVWGARDLHRRQDCAIKILQTVEVGGPVDERLLSSMQKATSLCHQYIVRTDSLERDEHGSPCLVMERLWGQTLHRYLQQQGPIPLVRAMELIHPILSALIEIHDRNLVHQAVRPQNIFLHNRVYGRFRTEQVKLLDFGQFTRIPTFKRRLHKEDVASLPYLAPECMTDEPISEDFRSDQWAVGVILYRMLTGVFPFPVEDDDVNGLLRKIQRSRLTPIVKHSPDLPECTTVALERALSKRKEDRFPTLREFLRALDGLHPIPFYAVPISIPSLLPRHDPTHSAPKRESNN